MGTMFKTLVIVVGTEGALSQRWRFLVTTFSFFGGHCLKKKDLKK